PKMNLELPKQNFKVEGNTLKVGGWVLHGAEIKEVKIYLNDEFLGQAKLGIDRPDVNRAFPNYPKGDKSGFSGEFNINHVVSGEKIVKVEALANDGSKITRISKIILEKKPSKMNLELPKQNEIIEGSTLKVGGWALHGSGIREVKLYVDNEFIGNLNVGLKRGDVNRVFPNYDNGENSGFSGEFNLNNIPLGEKVIKTIAIGNDGTEIVRTCKVNIKKKQPKMNLERATIINENNETYLNVAGWALHDSAVKEIKVYVDNDFIGNAPLGLYRPDVNRVFKNYPNGEHSGFKEKFNMKFISPGEKEVKVEVVGNDGTTITKFSKITLKKKPSKLNLEEPTNGLTLEGRELKIAGWALNDSGIKKVKIYVDDTYVGNANLGAHRPDVNRIFKNYVNGEYSGFTAKFDIRNFTPGYHNIKAVAIGNDNTFREMSKSIKFNHKKLIVIDPG
ncbi:MAG: Ig-like domain-containing protein, partial [Sarcina sp.]